MPSALRLLLVLLVFSLPANVVGAQDEAASDDAASEDSKPAIATAVADGVKVEVLVEGLSNPCGVAVRHRTGGTPTELFISDSGANRVVAFSGKKSDELTEVVKGFATAPLPEVVEGPVGPLGVAFLFDSRTRLLVGSSDGESGQGVLNLYEIYDEKLPLEADATKSQVGPLKADDAGAAAGAFYSLQHVTKGEQRVFITSSSPESDEGWLLVSNIKAGKVRDLSRFFDVAKAAKVAGPRGMTMSQKGYLLVSQIGSLETQGDSLLGFYNPYDSKAAPALTLETGLDDVFALAYSPSGNLYAADFAANDPERGGIYRLDAQRDEATKKMGCKAVKLASIPYPTAIDFDDDGNLIVTSLGESKDPGKKAGVLVKISGEL